MGCAIEVHKQLGPGLLESTYEQCRAHELALHQLPYTLQQQVPVQYKGVSLDCGYRIDCLVDNKIILELKSVESLKPIHEAQLLTYMKLMQVNVGLLINFNSLILKNGIKRFIL
ncbi:GxxExxY protein [Shewanella woodyi]|uniref:GxxExxY protein n=1 Tax=Shewanella woodyi TaxID=60961 RepID=UPI003749697C